MTLVIGTAAFLALLSGYPAWGLVLLSVAAYRVLGGRR
jgi:hypothetical protein